MSLIHPYFDIGGVDISHWQGPIDWGLLASKASFAIIRSGDGIAGGSFDRQWINNWSNAKGKLPRGAYWFYRTNVTPELQAQWVIKSYDAVGGDMGELGFYVDLELNDARLTMPAHTAHLNKFIALIDAYFAAHAPKTPLAGIYTSAGYWNGKIDPTKITALDARPLWVAQWPNLPSPRPTAIPTGWAHWDFWQFSAKGDGRAYLGPQAGRALDMDVFHGSSAEFAQRFGLGTLPPPPVDNRLVVAFRPARANMNIRNKPSEIASVIIAKTMTEPLPVVGKTTDERGRIWYKLGASVAAEMWISATVGEAIYA